MSDADPVLLNKVRDRLWHALDPDVAASAGLTVWHLQQIVACTFFPSQEQLIALAIRLRMVP
jgi:hypothetical protein